LELFYKDESVIVCKKPAGLVSEGGSGMGVPDLLGKELAAEGERPLLYPVNRLDREAEGLLLLARNEQAAAALSRQVAEHLMQKEYLAVVFGEPEEPSGIYRDLLFHDRNKNKTYVTDRLRKGVKEAVLRYHTLGSADFGGKKLTLLQIRLETGRTHQIRVQFASRKMPLFGDGKYGGGSGKLALQSHRITFRHPSSGETVTVAAPFPEGTPWDLFPENE
jgi:23S rRNA pseudouridine1911/1915/1917 synthase